MVLELVEAVATKLKENYPDFDIINDTLQQGFKNVIFIKCYSKYKRVMGERKKIKVRLYFTIFIDDKEDSTKLTELGHNLYDILEFINLNKEVVRGTDYSFRVNEKDATAIIDYNIWTYKNKEEPYMTEYRTERGING